jgi:hypothetical protein
MDFPWFNTGSYFVRTELNTISTFRKHVLSLCDICVGIFYSKCVVLWSPNFGAWKYARELKSQWRGVEKTNIPASLNALPACCRCWECSQCSGIAKARAEHLGHSLIATKSFLDGRCKGDMCFCWTSFKICQVWSPVILRFRVWFALRPSMCFSKLCLLLYAGTRFRSLHALCVRLHANRSNVSAMPEMPEMPKD